MFGAVGTSSSMSKSYKRGCHHRKYRYKFVVVEWFNGGRSEIESRVSVRVGEGQVRELAGVIDRAQDGEDC